MKGRKRKDSADENVEAYRHETETRKNVVPAGLVSYDTSTSKPKKYEYDPHLDNTKQQLLTAIGIVKTMDRTTSFTVHDLPKSERPRERLKRFGPEALSAQELLALLIGRGVSKKSVMTIAQELLTRFGNIKAISEATLEELSQIKGIGFAKAAQIKACFELGKRQDLEPELKDFDIKDPQSFVKAIRASIKDKAKEHFKLILLNVRNKIIGISTVSIGSLNASIVHPREVFKDAITHNAYSVVLAHNHPSGDSEPSEDDIKMTQKLVESGKILGIEVIDHLIITKNGYFSFKDKGVI